MRFNSPGTSVCLPNVERDEGDCNQEGTIENCPERQLLSEAEKANGGHNNPGNQYRELPESDQVHTIIQVEN